MSQSNTEQILFRLLCRIRNSPNREILDRGMTEWFDEHLNLHPELQADVDEGDAIDRKWKEML